MRGFWGNLDSLYNVNLGENQNSTKAQNFDKYKNEIEKTDKYIKEKRRAFYKKNNIKEK